ncbi:MAG: dihydroorotase family protein [Candidatus Margulisiibacteriota bacterium]
MSKTVFINGKVYDPYKKSLDSQNILISEGKIIGLGYLPDDDPEQGNDVVIQDIGQCWVVPYTLDLHTRVGQQGNLKDGVESVKTLTQAAAMGGLTAVGIQDAPKGLNTAADITALINRSEDVGPVNVFPIGTLSKGRQGQELSELGLMKQAGAVAFSDFTSVQRPELFVQALRYSRMMDLPLFVRPNDAGLAGRGVMNEGAMATRLGLPSLPSSAEEVALARDITLLSHYGGNLHVFPITTKWSLELVRQAKSIGLSITCGTALQYLTFTEDNIEHYDTTFKVHPPLRTKEDTLALIEGVQDGTIDVLSCDHEPSSLDEKRQDFISASFGMSGLDTFLPALVSILHHEHKLAPATILDKITLNPHAIIRQKPKGIGLGSLANFVVIDPQKTITADPEMLASAGKHNPFVGRPLKGYCRHLVIGGHLLY